MTTVTVHRPPSTVSIAYNGLGDRLQQTVNGSTTNYTLDLSTGLTQVLNDGTNIYTHGLGRISQRSGDTPEYFITDGLGSIRQLTHQTSAILVTKSYDPYGNVISSTGSVESMYGFTGEQTDPSGIVYLQARYYSPLNGRFLTKHPSRAESNLYSYSRDNTINRIDPSGLYSSAMIEKNINQSEFLTLGFMDETNHDRFGFYKFLLEAQDLD